nr:MAG: RNA-dependent RNA polymerase [Wufeng shrew phenuivirus 6]
MSFRNRFNILDIEGEDLPVAPGAGMVVGEPGEMEPIATVFGQFREIVETAALSLLEQPPCCVYKPPHIVYDATSYYAVPNYSIKETSPTLWELSILPEDRGESVAEAVETALCFNPSKINDIPHNLVFSSWPDTDVPIAQIFPKIALDSCKEITTTPDQIVSSANGHSIIEFGTTRGHVINAWSEKVKKYSRNLDVLIEATPEDERQQFPNFSVGAIMVGKGKVVSSYDLGPNAQTIVNVLCSLMRFAMSVQTKLVDHHGLVDARDFSEEIKELMGVMGAMTDKVRDYLPEKDQVRPLFMTKEWYDNSTSWVRSENNEDEKKRVNHMAQFYYNCMREQLETLPRTDKQVKDMHEKEREKYNKDVNDYWKKVDEVSASRGETLSTKSIVPLPFLIPKENRTQHHDMPKLEGTFMLKCSADSGLLAIWQDAKNHYNNLEEATAEDNGCWESAIMAQSDMRRPKKESRGRAFRFSLRSGSTAFRYILERGVGLAALQYTDQELYKSIRKPASKVISRRSPTEDIEKWVKIEAPKVLSAPYSRNTAGEVVDELIDFSMQHHMQSLESHSRVYTQTAGTVGFNLCEFYSEVAQEIIYASKRQNSVSSWMLRKLPNYECWVVSHHSYHEKITFFSLAIPKEAVGFQNDSTVFRQLIDCNDFWLTELISAPDSKMKNWFTCLGNYMGSLVRWMEYEGSGVPATDEEELSIPEEVYKSTALCMLISLEDKVLTEEAFTSIRYTCMDKCVLSAVPVDPTKMLEKGPDYFRTRLQLWAVKKHVSYMNPRTWTKNSLGEESDALSQQVTWSNVMHPFLDYPIKDSRQVVDTYYLGYAKNKDEASQDNADLTLTGKLLKEEVSFRNTDDQWVGYTGAVKTEEHEKHEYSMTALQYAADSTRQKFKREVGPNWESVIRKDILRGMVEVTWEQLSTLKATSNFDGQVVEPSYNTSTKRKERYNYHRSKVIEKMVKMPKEYDSLRPFQALNPVLRKLVIKGELDVDIFRKLQHGGVREIYVVTSEVRLVQKFVELIARVICSHFPGEALSNPLCKTSAPIEHAVKSHKMKRSEDKLFNLNSSNDAKTWSQNMDVGKLGAFMLGVTPRLFHGFIVRVLKLWENKVIRPPDSILNLAAKYEKRQHELKLDDELSMSMIRGLWGVESNTFTCPRRKAIMISSGFMQGILHFTSSALHAGVLHGRDRLFKLIWWRAGLSGARLLTHDLVSSDDSARLVTASVPDGMKNSLRRLCMHYDCDQLCAKKYFRASGIVMSPKSTHCTPGMVEFNSVYHYGPSVIKPTIKWVFSAFSVVETESLFSRQETFYSLLTQLIEGGLSFSAAHTIQVVQAQIHYRVSGLYSGFHPVEVKELYLENPSPMLGFFMMDDALCAGLLGLRYTHYMHVKKNPILSQSYAGLLLTSNQVSTPEGSIIHPFFLRFAEKTKWEHLMDEVSSQNPNWAKEISEDPSILYTEATTIKECQTKIIVKLSNPSVVRSLDSNHGVTRMAASGVYILQHPCITSRPKWWQSQTGTEDIVYTKRSLIHCLQSDTELAESKPQLTADQFSFLFPQKEEYDSLSAMLLRFPETIEMRANAETKKIRISVPVFGSDRRRTTSLEMIAKHKWFGTKIPYSTTTIEQLWQSACHMISWLRETADETLKESPFKDHLQLRAFLSRESSVSRTVILYGVSGHHKMTENAVISLIRRHYRLGYDLVLGSDVNLSEDEVERNLCMLRLKNLCNSPFTNEKSTEVATNIIKSLKSKPIQWSVLRGSPHYSMQCLEIMRKVVKARDAGSDYKMWDFFQDLRDLKMGAHGYFIREGSKTEGQYTGLSSWRGSLGRCEVHINFDGPDILSLTTNDLSELQKEEFVLRNLLNDLKARACIPGSTESGRLLCKGVSGFCVSPPVKDGCPIVVNPNMHPILEGVEHLSIRNLFITANNGKVSICMPAETLERGTQGVVRVLTMKPLPLINSFSEDFSKNNPTGSKQVVEDWVNGRPLSPGHGKLVLDILRAHKDEKSYSGILLKELKNLARMGFYSAVSRYHYEEVMNTPLVREEIHAYEEEEIGRIMGGGLAELDEMIDFDIAAPLANDMMEAAGIDYSHELDRHENVPDAMEAMLEGLNFERQDGDQISAFKHPWLSSTIEAYILEWGMETTKMIAKKKLPARMASLAEFLEIVFSYSVELVDEANVNLKEADCSNLNDLL